MMLNILYFAKLADELGCKQETLTISAPEITLTTLKAQLSTRGDAWQTQLNAPTTRCAVNQVLVNDNTVVSADAEIAFFPPITGG